MACPGGCVGGGGQPRSADKQIVAKRQAALYNLDQRSTIRRCVTGSPTTKTTVVAQLVRVNS